MTYRAVILTETQKEYEEIVFYLAEVLKSPQAALHFMDEFDYQIDLIVDNPELYVLSRMPELAARGYRSVLVCSYIVLYRVYKDVVAIAHMFHQSQDYATLI